MNPEIHERARQLIALRGPEGISRADQDWLTAHLDSCASCRDFADNSHEAVSALRTISVTADAGLVSTTQRRVRLRVQELQRRQERLWLTCICCTAVTLGAAFTTAVLWSGFSWMGQQLRLAPPEWELSLAVFCLMPGILAAILLLAQGTHLADRNGSYRG